MTGHTFTHPDVLTVGVEQGWADPETDPTRIDWPARQARALIPFNVVGGRPVNPCDTTAVRYGRNELGHWGEAVAADALVAAADPNGHRWVVMVERKDGHGWALPGGFVEPGEDPADAAVRELREETGLVLPVPFGKGRPGWRWRVSAPRYVPDPRASGEAWMVTVLARIDIGVWPIPPVVTGSDDAERAAWVRADSYEVLVGELATRYGGRVFAAHRDMLAEALNDGSEP